MTDVDLDLDLDRLPYEIKRALWAAGYVPGLLELGLNITHPRVDGTVGLVDVHGDELAALPVYRLRHPDPDLVAVWVEEVAADAGLGPADMADARVVSLADDEFVEFRHGARRWRLHRSRLVPSWPDDDLGEPEVRVFPFRPN